jgi:hypothetical protein
VSAANWDFMPIVQRGNLTLSGAARSFRAFSAL